ncbi:MAG: hypothetical protein ACOYYJ_08455 [Chloroflexota bacterium]
MTGLLPVLVSDVCAIDDPLEDAWHSNFRCEPCQILFCRLKPGNMKSASAAAVGHPNMVWAMNSQGNIKFYVSAPKCWDKNPPILANLHEGA